MTAFAAEQAPERTPFVIDLDIVKAIAWCRIGGLLYRPASEDAFHRAKALGLLAQDNIWRATERGEGVLVALGLLEGKPAPRRTMTVLLWARSPNFSTPHFVTAWGESLDEIYHEEARILRGEGERRFADLARGEVWTFWTTFAFIDLPEVLDVA